MKATLIIAPFIFIFCGFALIGSALAQPAEAPLDAGAPAAAPTATPQPVVEKAPTDLLGEVIQGARGGHWRMVGAAALSLLMFGFNWARKNVGWMKKKLAGDRAGAISLLVMALAGGLLLTLRSDAPLDFKTLTTALWTAAEAAGVFTLVKKIWKPAD